MQLILCVSQIDQTDFYTFQHSSIEAAQKELDAFLLKIVKETKDLEKQYKEWCKKRKTQLYGGLLSTFDKWADQEPCPKFSNRKLFGVEISNDICRTIGNGGMGFSITNELPTFEKFNEI